MVQRGSLSVLVRAWLVSLLLAAVAGCVSSGAIEDLEVTLSGLQFTDTTLFETTMVATIRVANPNPDPISFEGASFKLYLDDRKVGTGLVPEPFTVDGLGSTVVNATFYVNNATAVFRIVDVLREKREISYGVRGSLFTDGTFGRRALRVERMGRLDLEHLEVPQAVDRPSAGDL